MTMTQDDKWQFTQKTFNHMRYRNTRVVEMTQNSHEDLLYAQLSTLHAISHCSIPAKTGYI